VGEITVIAMMVNFAVLEDCSPGGRGVADKAKVSHMID